MSTINPTIEIESAFSMLPPERRADIIYHGTALRLAELNKRHFLAISKVREYEEQYQTRLEQLDCEGLPGDASYEMHEDYIMWHHWASVAEQARREIQSLEPIIQHGLPLQVS